MNSALEDGMLRLGCLVTVIGAAVLVTLGICVNWIYATGAVCAIVMWVLLSRLKIAADERRLRSGLVRAFSSAQHLMPRMAIERSYGFTRITLEFTSSENLAEADKLGCMQSFRSFVQSLFGHLGTKQNPFDVSRAVYAHAVAK